MENYEVSICMEPEKDNQGRERFRWCLIKYEKTRGLKKSCSTHRHGFAYSRVDALNEGIKAYEALTSEVMQSKEETLSVKNMFFNRNFEGLRALAYDPVTSNKLSFDALLCVILAMAINRKAYQATGKIEELLKRLTFLHRASETIGSDSMAIITDERLASLTNATELHKLAQICNLISIMLSINELPSELVSFFREAARVWRQRAVKPPVHMGEELVTRAYDLMELGEGDQAEEYVMMALSKGITGNSLITAANVLSQVGQYNLAEEIYIKALKDITDEDLIEIIQESLNKVREKQDKCGITSLAAATRIEK